MPSTPVSGAETTITITVNGVPVILDGQVTGASADQKVTLMEHKPLGTMAVKKSQDFEGWSGKISAKKANNAFDLAIDAIDAATRLGVPAFVVLTITERFPNFTSSAYLYSDVKLSLTGGSTRGSHNTADLSWETGEQRVAL